MQGNTATHSGTACQVVDISNLRGCRKGMVEQSGKRQGRTRGIDDKFVSLDERKQRAILSHMIGYMEASKDLISSGRRARNNEVSRIFEVMEDMIDKSWNGGLV